MNRCHLRRLLAAGLALSLLGAACSDDDDAGEDTTADATDAPDEGAAAPVLSDEDALAAATGYADLVVAAYDDSIAAATDLQGTLDELVAAPGEETLQAAKDSWLAARDVYGPTEVFRFYDGPIDAPDTGPEGRINAWPLDEAYIDYVEGDDDAGLINDVDGTPEITADVIVAANEQGGESNVSTGWHAIEFLLWGQDQSDDGPGARPVTDYTDSPVAERRAAYLTALGQLLVDDLTSVRDEWDPDAGEYREEFLADPHQAVTNILRGMGALSKGELAGERILVAYDTQDQEDEHSCFSDNTQADIVANAEGIRVAYTADWPGVDVTSLSSVVVGVDPDLDADLREQLGANVLAAEGLDGPFDVLISGDEAARATVLDLGESLQAQGDTVAEVAAALGYEISLDI